MKRLVAAAAMTFAAAFAAQAADEERPFKFIVGIGLTGGGATLARVNYTNGDSQNIKAGGLVMLYAGGETRIGELVSLQVTAGYHIDGTNASNGKVRFSRYPIDVLAFFPVNDKLRFGAGAQFVNSPKLRSSGAASGNDRDFDSTTGFVLEGEYRFTPMIGVKLRGVSEKFKESTTGNRVSGNHGGVLMNLYF
jgi:opacity protein-like surface antigen